MAESEQDRIFRTKVIPIMNKVRNELQDKMADELKEHTSSFAGLMASAIGPDGGMSARQAQMQSLRYTGEWNSKTAEDYIEMVKKELQRQHIIVDSAMEKKMIDKMIQDKIPRSSIEYILKKAATNTIFYLPQEVAKSPLEHYMDTEAEKRYNPSEWEKNTGIILGSVTDLACMGGAGGGWKTAATWVGGDFLLSKFSDKQEDRSDIPSIVRPGCEEQYRQDQEKMKKQEEEKHQAEQERNRKNTPPEVQEVLDKGNEFLDKIHRSNDAIPGMEISAKISRMELIVEKIFERAQKHPEIIPDLKKLMNYYLPMTVKLLDAYEEMDQQPVQGENIQASKKEIEDTLDTLNQAFEKLLDSVFQDTAWDVSSDISVLHTLLAQEGLTDDDFAKMKKN